RGVRAFVAGAVIGAAALWSVTCGPGLFTPVRHVHTASANHDLRDWIGHQAAFGHRKIFDHLGPTVGAAEGLVIAAPSKEHPDYFYTWTRDSAIVTGTILDRLLAGENELEATLRLYAYSQAGLQKTCNPSGCPTSGGLGEPKFHVDGTPFTKGWGRPQRDGPALRAITLTRFANYLLDRGQLPDHKFVSKFLYNRDTSSGNSVIKNDLEFTSHGCFWPSFDLWEEVMDLHFFTLMACRKALSTGSALALRLGDPGASHSAVLLAILVAGEERDPDFSPTSPAVLASVKVYVDAFRGMYAIANETGQREGTDPVPTGRYP
ncbi:hypothetical protein FRC12_024353, partial [Ceratobasidium sp. 428]